MLNPLLSTTASLASRLIRSSSRVLSTGGDCLISEAVDRRCGGTRDGDEEVGMLEPAKGGVRGRSSLGMLACDLFRSFLRKRAAEDVLGLPDKLVAGGDCGPACGGHEGPFSGIISGAVGTSCSGGC